MEARLELLEEVANEAEGDEAEEEELWVRAAILFCVNLFTANSYNSSIYGNGMKILCFILSRFVYMSAVDQLRT